MIAPDPKFSYPITCKIVWTRIGQVITLWKDMIFETSCLYFLWDGKLNNKIGDKLSSIFAWDEL